MKPYQASPMLGFSFSLRGRKGQRTKRGQNTLQHEKHKKPSSHELSPTHVPSPSVWKPFDKSWAQFFSAQSRWLNLFWKTRANLWISSVAGAPPSYFHSFPKISRAISNGFQSNPRCIRAPSPKDPRSYFHSFLPVHAACSLQQSPPQTVSTVSFPSRCLLAPAFFQTASNPSYFQRFPIHPHSRSLPMELSPYFWGFLSVHAACSLSPSYFHNFTSVHAACSLPPSETPPKLFPTVSNPTLHSRSQRGPPKLYSASTLHARFLPAQPPQAISNGFLSVRDASPAPNAAARTKLFATISCPSTLHARSSPARPPKLLPIRPSTPS